MRHSRLTTNKNNENDYVFKHKISEIAYCPIAITLIEDTLMMFLKIKLLNLIEILHSKGFQKICVLHRHQWDW